VTVKGKALGTVTRRMVRKRARELADISGRTEGKVLDSDVKEARRELTGKEGLVPRRTPAERLPEESRWKTVAESVGRRGPKVPPPDEQTVAEELVEEGVEEAEHDLMVRAVRKQRRDRS